MRRWWILLGVVLALGVALRAALPWALARVAESQAASQLGLDVRIADLDLRLLEGALAVEGVELVRRDAGSETAGASSPLLRWDALQVDLGWLDLLDGRLHLSVLRLDGPVVRLEWADGALVDPLADAPFRSPGPEPEEPEEPEAAGASAAWPISIERLEIRAPQVALADAADGRELASVSLDALDLVGLVFADGALGTEEVAVREPRVVVDDALLQQPPADAPAPDPDAPPPAAGEPFDYASRTIALETGVFTLRTGERSLEVSLEANASDFALTPGHRFPLELELGIDEGTLAADGEVALSPFAFSGRVRWQDLPLPPLTILRNPELLDWLTSCRAWGDAELTLRLAPGEEPAVVEVSGTGGIRDFAFADPQRRDLVLAWKQLELDVTRAVLPLSAGPDGRRPPARLDLARVEWQEPVFHYARPPEALDAFLARLGLAGEDAEPAGEDGGAPAQLRLAAFDLVDGELRFQDRTVSPAHESELRAVQASVRDLRWPEADARALSVRAIAPGNGPLALEGDLDGGSGDLRIDLERLALLPFQSLLDAAGYQVERGRLTLASDLRVGELERVDARNHVVLHDLRVQARDPGQFEKTFGIGIDLALALLRDPGGDIALDVPLDYGRGTVGVGWRGVLQRALRQALTSALQSPLKLLRVGRGGAGEPFEIAPLRATPSLVELADGEDARFDAILTMLADRPQLGLRLRGSAGPADVAEGEGPDPSELPALAASRAERLQEVLVERGVDPAQLELGEVVVPGEPGVAFELRALR